MWLPPENVLHLASFVFCFVWLHFQESAGAVTVAPLRQPIIQGMTKKAEGKLVGLSRPYDMSDKN